MESAEAPVSDEGFRSLGLSETSLSALEHAGFREPSPVQQQLIPPALEGRDCIGNAPTGTGKTAAFLLPIIEKLDENDRRPQALILAPTRELAHQIGREFERLSAGRRLMAAPLVGGESIVQQVRMLRRGCQVLLATPGRIMDLMERGEVRLETVKFVVLDEADQMLDIGFRPAVDAILETVPAERQTLLLSATMPKGVRELAKRELKDPADVRLIREDEDATVKAIRQSYIMVEPHSRFDLLVGLLKAEDPARAIIFCRTKLGADRLGTDLRQAGFKAEAMHGDLSQSRRHRVLGAFRMGRLHILVATDVVGRGIDVPGISHVINFDLPEDVENYVHRIGRTGRMGKDGIAYSIVLPDQGRLLDDIEKTIQRTLERHEVEGIYSPARPMPPRRGAPGPRRPFRGGRFGGNGPSHPVPARRGIPLNGERRRRFGPKQRAGY